MHSRAEIDDTLHDLLFAAVHVRQDSTQIHQIRVFRVENVQNRTGLQQCPNQRQDKIRFAAACTACDEHMRQAVKLPIGVPHKPHSAVLHANLRDGDTVRDHVIQQRVLHKSVQQFSADQFTIQAAFQLVFQVQQRFLKLSERNLRRDMQKPVFHAVIQSRKTGNLRF